MSRGQEDMVVQVAQAMKQVQQASFDFVQALQDSRNQLAKQLNLLGTNEGTRDCMNYQAADASITQTLYYLAKVETQVLKAIEKCADEKVQGAVWLYGQTVNDAETELETGGFM